MKRTTLRHGLLLLTATAGIGATLGYVAPADAASPVVLKIAPGIGGDIVTAKELEEDKNAGQEYGPGNEQSVAAVFNKDGKQYVVSIYMSSNVNQGDNESYWQCKCSSTLMDPVFGPMVVKDQIQLTDNGGSRSCNHPGIASNGADYGVWTYGSNDVNGNTRFYALGINEKCEVLTDRVRISEDNDQNENAGLVRYVGNDTFVSGYLSTANNDKDASYAAGIYSKMEGGKAMLQKTWLTNVVNPSNIGRPAIVEAGADRAFFCASQGNNRPPEDGVTCALLNTATGEVLHKELIAKSDPEKNVYYNQPTVAKLANGRYAVMVLKSNGLGKKNNIKGSNEQKLYAFKVTGDSFLQEAYIDKVGANPTHSAICSGAYGEKGDTYVAVMGASPTGLGQPDLQFVNFNGAGFTVPNRERDNWTIGFAADAGYLNNIYGANPNTQGRNFLNCVGDVKNPGFGMTGGFMPEVETFFLAPHEGNDGTKNEPKLAAYLSFVPGKVAQAAPQEPPKVQPKTGAPPVPAGYEPPTTYVPIDEYNNGENGSINTDGPQNVACAASNSNSSSPFGLAFLAMGVGALLAARRRK